MCLGCAYARACTTMTSLAHLIRVLPQSPFVSLFPSRTFSLAHALFYSLSFALSFSLLLFSLHVSLSLSHSLFLPTSAPLSFGGL